MDDSNVIGHNVARLRLDRDVSQDEVASKAGISRLALGKIERGEVVPRAATLEALAKALGTSTAELVTAVRPLHTVRFRAPKVKGRQQILAEVSRWLEDYCWLEGELKAAKTFPLEKLRGLRAKPEALAKRVREEIGLGPKEPIRDICGLLEDNGIKVLLLDKKSDAFFGLSVAEGDGGPAVVVNTWERISVERWIFTAAHELAHLLLHQGEYSRDESEEPKEAEHEADTFASHFLMPEAGVRFGVGRHQRPSAARPRAEGEAHVPCQLQDRALPPRRDRAGHARRLARSFSGNTRSVSERRCARRTNRIRSRPASLPGTGAEPANPLDYLNAIL